MKILEIKKYPEKILRINCQAVEKITPSELALFQDMLCTMHNACGVGLAAPQIGLTRQILVADIGQGPIQLANPEVIKAAGKDALEEGCLSVPGARVNIIRPTEIIVKGLNEQGQVVQIKADGLLARVLLHEIDHLQGKLIIDYMNLLAKLRFNLSNRRQGGR